MYCRRETAFGPRSAIILALTLLAPLPEAARAEDQAESGRTPGRVVLGQVPARTSNRGAIELAGLRPESDLPIGSRIVSLDMAEPGSEPIDLTAGFAAAGRPQTSFDGRRILFVGRRKPGEPLSVWEANADGSDARQITALPTDCTQAVYLSTIYTLGAERLFHQIALCGRAAEDDAPALYTCRLDGTHLRQITFNPYGASDPCPLSDGRLLYCSGLPPDAKAGAARAVTNLMTVNTDGTDVFVFAPSSQPGVQLAMPCETPDSLVCFVEAAADGPDGGGRLAAVLRSRSLYSRRVIADDPAGLYHSPSAVPDGRLLVSYRSGTGGVYGVYLLDPETGKRIAEVCASPQWHCVHAAAVAPRPQPAGRASVVKDELETGLLYCLNAYLSDAVAERGIQSVGIKKLRVFKTLPEENAPTTATAVFQSSRQSAVQEELLGEAPVEQDGSFYLEVPARTPLRLETLDETGGVWQAMQSWIWVMPKEVRGCIGCHEDRELTPPNRHPLALWRPPHRLGVIAADELGKARLLPKAESREGEAPQQPEPRGTGVPPVSASTGDTPVPQLVTPAPQREVDIPFYVGQAACLECHESGHGADPCRLEPIPKHNESFKLLGRPEAPEIAFLCGVPEPPTESRICLGCHATAADAGRRWRTDTFRVEDGVQCEACHGPGSLHAEVNSLLAPPQLHATQDVRPGDRLFCRACHTKRPSHEEVVLLGFQRSPEDSLYKTPVNLAVSPDGTRLYAVCEHSNSLIAVDPASGDTLGEVRVGRRPNDVAVSLDGRTLYVTNRLDDTVAIIDAESMQVTRVLDVGDEPHGVLTDRTGRFVYVLNAGDDSIAVVDTSGSLPARRLAGGRGPWSAAMSLDGAVICATNVRPNFAAFRDPPASEITLIDTEHRVVKTRALVPEANMLEGVAYVPGRGAALFTLVRTKNLVPMTRLAQGWTVTNGLGVLRPDSRVDQVLLDEPNACFPDPADVAVTPDGRFALVTSGGLDAVAVIDVEKLLGLLEAASDRERRGVLPNHLGASARFVVKRVAVGKNPRGIVFSPDGRFACVANALDDSISVIDTVDWTVARTIDLGGPKQITELRWGERLFHDARITFGQQFSCRSCHPDGHINGLTFDIEADGIGARPVDNLTLRGIVDTGPFKWEGTNPTLAYQCGPRLAVFFTRLAPFTPEELQALVRYECTIERPPNRHRQPDGLTLPQRRGKMIFERTIDNHGRAIPNRSQCATCHMGAYGTIRASNNVGTAMWFDAPMSIEPDDLHDGDSFGQLGIAYYAQERIYLKFDVPSLCNVYESAPYLHNGGAATLEEVWTRHNLYEDHGYTRDLTRQQFNDLIEYLKAF